MAFSLPELPYAKDALALSISPETIEFHHGAHHNAICHQAKQHG